jgi:hypothetical protein
MPLRPVPIAAMADPSIESPGLFLADDEAAQAGQPSPAPDEVADKAGPASGQARPVADGARS